MISIRVKASDVSREALHLQVLNSTTVEEFKRLIVAKGYIEKDTHFGLKLTGKRKPV
jgi:Mn-dependent DtxR family transcriptional regulator